MKINKRKHPHKKVVSYTNAQYEEIFSAAIYPITETSTHQTIGLFSKLKMKSNKRNHPLRKFVSYTNEQYEEIFSAAIYPIAESTKRHTVGLKVGPNTIEIDSDFDLDGSLSTIYTEDFLKNAVTSTPIEAKNSSAKKDRLKQLQRRRYKGLFVQCYKCQKWRWLENPDPDDLPQKWNCYMNSDLSMASCLANEVAAISKDDKISSKYMPGSIVWAKYKGFPWWPAMVDDCPDCEQYYWVDDERQKTPGWYNVIFFDKTEVTRQWIPVDKLFSYKQNPDLLKKKKVKIIRKFKHRLGAATQKATTALNLSVKERLRQFSFLALWKKDFPEYKK